MPPKRGADSASKPTTPSKRAKTSSTVIGADTQVQTSSSRAQRAARTPVDPIANQQPIKKGKATSASQISKPEASKAKKSEERPVEATVEETKVTKLVKSNKENGTKAVVKKTKAKLIIAKDEEDHDEDFSSTKTSKAPSKRKTKEEKEAEAMPLKPRTPNLRMFVGAHVSGAGGVQNSVTNALHIGGNAFALFLKSQRKWDNPALKSEHRDEFKNLCSHHVYAADKHVLPHGSYLVNLAQAEKEKADQAFSSFLDDIKRCEALGIKLYNFHPGNTGPHPRNEAISRIARQLNKAIKATSNVIPVLETMAGGGNAIGSTFEDLRDIIAGVEDKSRVGVCIDTCHIFAAGYDIRTPEVFQETINKFDQIIGLKYLRGFHMNDSKAPFGSHRDLHQNIGQGFLGLRAFHSVMNEPRFEDIPMVLETPIDRKDENGKSVEDKNVWANEIKLLESLIGMDPSSEQYINLEKELAAKGAAERSKIQGQVDKKAEKDKKKAVGGKGKRKKAEQDTDLSDESD